MSFDRNSIVFLNVCFSAADHNDIHSFIFAMHQKEWSPDFIIADLPRTGTGSTGDVVVHVGNHASNPRRLKRWQGTLRYTWQDIGTLRLMAEMDVDVRMDAAPIRQKPGQKPFRVEGLGAAIEPVGLTN